MKAVNVVIVGFGVIGKALGNSLLEKRRHLESIGLKFNVVAVCDIAGSVVEGRGLDLKHLMENGVEDSPGFTEKNLAEVLEIVDCDIVVELTPGDIKTGEPGLSHIRQALERGINVVTSNKSPLAVAYGELMELAGKNNARLLFEATVGGAIPVLGLKEKGLAGNSVSNVLGVLNGTCNYILSKMTREEVPLNLALAEAQELGYAETDPAYDIEGIDTAAKVVILANHFMGKKAKFSDVKVSGITKVTPEALELAREKGYVIKLVGDAKNLQVGLRLIPQDHPLNVSDSLNAVLIETDLAGDVSLIGHGAGGRQTSSAIISDMVRVADSL